VNGLVVALLVGVAMFGQVPARPSLVDVKSRASGGVVAPGEQFELVLDLTPSVGRAAFDARWESGLPFTIVIAPDGTEICRVEGEADILALRRRILGHLPDAGMFAGNTDYWRN
jgi:hypothetical protein